jgi:hypothetical protein
MFRLGVFLLFPLLAAAQLTPNSVTVTASRAIEIQADQFRFGITIDARPDAGLDDVLAVARGAGLTAANFTGIGYNSGGDRVAWYFVVAVPIAQMKSTIGLLNAVQTDLAKDAKYSLYFSVGGLSTSAQAQQAQACPIADVITDARASAAKLASAAGLTVGAIQALSSPKYSFRGISGTVCSVTVKFALGGI